MKSLSLLVGTTVVAMHVRLDPHSCFRRGTGSESKRSTYVSTVYLKPKENLHFELPNISLLFLSLAKLNIAMSCWYPP